MTIDAVIFDVGNVLIEWNPERHFDRVLGEDGRKALFSAVDLHGMNLRVDRGADFQRSVFDLADAHPDWADEIRRWHEDWLHMAQPEIPQSVRMLRALRGRGVPVYALTNFGIGTWDVAARAYPFLTEFDRHFISGHMGVIKPEPRIYEMVEEQCGVPPERLLFTDDRPENIDAAAARGWQVHLFDGPQGWSDRLVAEGLLPQEAAA